eukprot:894123_1
MEPAWLQMSAHFENDTEKVRIARVDTTKNISKKTVHLFDVISRPTLLWFPGGQKPKSNYQYTEYTGKRTTGDLVHFVNRQIDPASVAMTIITIGIVALLVVGNCAFGYYLWKKYSTPANALIAENGILDAENDVLDTENENQPGADDNNGQFVLMEARD